MQMAAGSRSCAKPCFHRIGWHSFIRGCQVLLAATPRGAEGEHFIKGVLAARPLPAARAALPDPSDPSDPAVPAAPVGPLPDLGALANPPGRAGPAEPNPEGPIGPTCPGGPG